VPEKIRERPYLLRLVRTAWDGSREELQGHLRSTVVTTLVSLALGAGTGAVNGGIVGALVGGLGAPLLVALGLFLWKLLSAPATLYRQQEAAIRELSGREKKAGGAEPLLTIEVTKAEFWWTRDVAHIPQEEVLSLELLVTARNPLGQELRIRPATVALYKGGEPIAASLSPRIAIDRMGRVGDYSHFLEGQHTIPPHNETVCFFWFDAVSPAGLAEFVVPGLELRVIMSIPGPWPDPEFFVPLPPLSLHPLRPGRWSGY
jgi:hypothetical protein